MDLINHVGDRIEVSEDGAKFTDFSRLSPNSLAILLWARSKGPGFTFTENEVYKAAIRGELKIFIGNGHIGD